MDARERILKTLDHEEPDKVPYTEHLVINPRLAQRLNMGGSKGKINMDKVLEFLGRIKGLKKRVNNTIRYFTSNPKFISSFMKKSMGSYFNLYKHIGVDFCVLPVGPYTFFKFVPPNIIINAFGHISELKTIADQFSAYYIGGAIKSEEMYDQFPSLNPEEPIGFLAYEGATRPLKDGKIYVVPGIFNGLFDSISLGLGIEFFSKVLIKNTSFLRRIISDREKYYTELIKKAIDLTGTEVFMMGDDLAYNSGPFISPRYFNKLFLPAYKRISNMIHKRGVKLVFHTDGDINSLLDGIVEFADSIHPWQASASMDIFAAKDKYGDKVCLEGNVPIDMLVHGQPSEIDAYVKKLIKICAPGGGYMLSSGNSIVPEIPPRNYIAMLRALRKYRNYPININSK